MTMQVEVDCCCILTFAFNRLFDVTVISVNCSCVACFPLRDIFLIVMTSHIWNVSDQKLF